MDLRSRSASPAPAVPTPPESSTPPRNPSSESRFPALRSVRWRIDLGVLPGPSAPIDDLRRAAANSRRRYATLRRRLQIDTRPQNDGNQSPGIVMDNPLSQNPDSIWGRFFRSAQLEKMVDQDLSRLYPEHGSYFQTDSCQFIMRRILLLWCLKHPEYGYSQGMPELLAPLLYVLNADLQHLSEVRDIHKDHFDNEFDGISFLESDLVSSNKFNMNSNDKTTEENSFQGSMAELNRLDEIDPDTRDIFLLSDAYGAEGELGVILSERFMEHDLYCMFESLMDGGGGVVAMAEFIISPDARCSRGSPPVIEASAALYHLLSTVDPPLHSHLVEIGVEPQYFALRWLCVLFGREFSLEDLLVIWDNIFSSPNHMSLTGIKDDISFSFSLLCSPRGALISALAVSMLLHMRSSLLASEDATTCLQRLLKFPMNANVKKLIENASSLQTGYLSNISSSSSHGGSNSNKPPAKLGRSLSSSSISSEASPYSLPESYWEEKWRVLHLSEDIHKGNESDRRINLYRTQSDPQEKSVEGNEFNSSTRRILSHESSTEANNRALGCDLVNGVEGKVGRGSPTDRTIIRRNSDLIEKIRFSADNSACSTGVSSYIVIENNDGNNSDKSCVTSASSLADNQEETNLVNENHGCNSEKTILRETEAVCANTEKNERDSEKHEADVKEPKPSSGKFNWFWRLARGSPEGNLDNGGEQEQKQCTVAETCESITRASTPAAGGSSNCRDGRRMEVGDKKLLETLRNLGQSMLDNIQVIESVFQQERGDLSSLDNLSNIILCGKGQAKALTALKELRSISNLLSEM